MNQFEALVQLFEKFPGIGKRQARRFSYFIARQPKEFTTSLISHIQNTQAHMKVCQESGAIFYAAEATETRSPIARDTMRNRHTLLVLATDADLENIEKSEAYSGTYFVLGGTLPLLAKQPETYIRMAHLKQVLEDRKDEIQEVILGLPVTPQGEHTEAYILEQITPLQQTYGFTITQFGRGVSTGSEIEYSDADTIKNALSRRTGASR